MVVAVAIAPRFRVIPISMMRLIAGTAVSAVISMISMIAVIAMIAMIPVIVVTASVPVISPLDLNTTITSRQ